MSGNRLLYSECLRIYGIEESFIEALHDSGLIHVVHEEERFIEYDELSHFEQFIRWHYDMDINVEGIEALHYMLDRVRRLQSEVDELRKELQFYRTI